MFELVGDVRSVVEHLKVWRVVADHQQALNVLLQTVSASAIKYVRSSSEVICVLCHEDWTFQ